MKTVSAKKIKRVLIELGLIKERCGNSTGHDSWRHSTTKQTCRPVLRKKDISYAILFSLAQEMVAKGLIPSRKALFDKLKTA